MNENETYLNCYICFEKVENHIQVCECQKICHIKCLHKWITTSNTDTCDICKKKYLDLTQYFIKKSKTPLSVIVTTILMILTITLISASLLYIIIHNIRKTNYLLIYIVIISICYIYLFSEIIKYYREHKVIVISIINQFENEESIAINIENKESENTSLL